MTSDSSLFAKRIRHLSLALMISGALNVGVLSFLLYWMIKESPPTPYCELQPANHEQQQIPLADQRGWVEALTELSQLSFSDLVQRLSHEQLIENGYAERDLALACLVAFHHFDIERALPKNVHPQQRRFLDWKPQGGDSTTRLVIYPGLPQEQFHILIEFAKNERWPLTAKGLFALLKEQKQNLDQYLVETFTLTPEFWTVDLLFNHSGRAINKSSLLAVLLEGNWDLLKQFMNQQRQLHDSSDARRQKFLLDYLKAGSSSAATLLLQMEWDFIVKKLDDQQVIAILQLMPLEITESLQFAKQMLASPRSAHVWKKAAYWLYKHSHEEMPREWSYEAVLARFCPEIHKIDLISKSKQPSSIAPLSLSCSKLAASSPVKPPAVVNQTKAIVPKISNSKPLKKVETVKKQHEYLVQQGDTLWKIARIFEVKVEELKLCNGLKNDTLKPGTILKIPDAKKSINRPSFNKL